MTVVRRFLDDETGTATIEFCFAIPIVMTIFMASVEASLYMARHAMMERSIDIVVRGIRLGNYDDLTHSELKTLICQGGMLAESVQTCVNSMQIWMQPINTANFSMVAPPHYCVDRSQPINPLLEPTGTEFAYGSDNEIMLMRICLKEDPMVPTSIIGAAMIEAEPDGDYALVTTTLFVNEPG
jgi:hypothetical protein